MSPPPAVSRKVKLGIGIAVLLLVIFAVVAGLLAPPGSPAVEAYLKDQLVREKITVDDLHATLQARRGRYVRFEVAGNGRFAPGKTYSEAWASNSRPLPAWLQLDQAEWARVHALLSGRQAKRLMDAAGLSADEASLANVTLLCESDATGDSPIFIHDIVSATPRGLKWKFTVEQKEHIQSDSGFRPLNAFPGQVYVIDRPEDHDRLVDLARRLPGIHERLERATVTTLLAENRDTIFGLVKPGALLAGNAAITAPNAVSPPARVFLEITEVRPDDNPPHCSALLRNDGSWSAARLFAGAITYDAAADGFNLELVSLVDKPEDAAGPFFGEEGGEFQFDNNSDGRPAITLRFDHRSLVGGFGRGSLRLEPVAPEARAAVIASVTADYRRLLEATRPGAVYAGVITNRTTGEVQKWKLSFTNQGGEDEAGGRPVEAMLEQPEHADSKSVLSGRVESNRYRARGAPLRLNGKEGAELPDAAKDILAAPENAGSLPDNAVPPAIPLALQDGKLAGESARYVFRFERAAP